MGNCEFKENGIPIPRVEGVVPKTIIKSGEKILNKLWSDKDIRSSKCIDVVIVDSSEKSPFMLYIEFETISPYLGKTCDEMIGNKFFPWNTKNPPSNLPKEIIKQCNLIGQLLNTKNLFMKESPRSNWYVLIELVPLSEKELSEKELFEKELSEKEKEVEILKKDVEDLKTHIACMPGGAEYLEVKKHWEENANL